MPEQPILFVSATTDDLRSARMIVKDALLQVGCMPDVEEIFAPDARKLRLMLRDKIKNCHGMIHLVGECYGSEPRNQFFWQSHRSYSQMEYDIAHELGKNIFVCLIASDYPYDSHKIEPERLQRRQQNYRDSFRNSEYPFFEVHTPGELAQYVLRNRTYVESMGQELRAGQKKLKRTIIGSTVILLIVAICLLLLWRESVILRSDAADQRRRIAIVDQAAHQYNQYVAEILAIAKAAESASGAELRDPILAAHETLTDGLHARLEDIRGRLATQVVVIHQLLAQVDERIAADSLTSEWRKVKRNLLVELGDNEYALAHYRDAVEPYRQAMQLTDKEGEGATWCNTAHYLASVQWRAGQYADAEHSAEAVVAKRSADQATEHRDLLASINLYAVILKARGHYDEAERQYRHVIEVRERTLGKENPDTLRTRVNLANLFQQAKRNLPEAEQICRETLGVQKRVLPKDHADTLTTMSTLSNVLLLQRNFSEAQSLCHDAWKARENTLGKEHPDTLISANNYAILLTTNIDDYAEANSIYLETLATQKRVLSPDHPDTLLTLNNLGVLRFKQQNMSESERLLREAVAAREKVLGEEHHDTLASLINLAGVLQSAKQYGEAEKLYRRVLTVQEATLVDQHRDLLRTRNFLCILLFNRGDCAGAEPLCRKVLDARTGTLGENHRDTLSTRSLLAQILAGEGKEGEAENLFMSTQQMMDHALPAEDRYRLDLDYYFSLLRMKQGHLAEALELAKKAVAGAQHTLPEANEDRRKYERHLQELLSRADQSSKQTP